MIYLLVLHILTCTDDVPDLYCTSSLVLKRCLIRTVHPHLYWWGAWFVLYILTCTEEVPDSYCTSSLVLMMCLTCTVHHRLYWRGAWFVLHDLTRTAHSFYRVLLHSCWQIENFTFFGWKLRKWPKNQSWEIKLVALPNFPCWNGRHKIL